MCAQILMERNVNKIGAKKPAPLLILPGTTIIKANKGTKTIGRILQAARFLAVSLKMIV